MLLPSPRDWPEDAAHDNGNYQCHCTTCDQYFIGYKRRLTCKQCATTEETRRAALTAEERAAEDSRNMERLAEWLLEQNALDAGRHP